ncbi:MAG: glutamate-1-semialdehyde 2,1-aminomutase [Planctomycetota bacterium]|nr:glutamate-1-semialdehyde 2,1-aminomutase [Planctomycetota bacterium]
MNANTSSRSHDLFERAQAVIPGGVSSPVRAFGAVGGEPPVIVRGAGSSLFDADGREYLDFVCSWGPLILGHSHLSVQKAVAEQLTLGTTFGAPCEGEVLLAEEIQKLTGVESLRFVSSGTEATMSAIRLARGVTGRDKLVKFSGCYHGHADHLLVSAGSGLATFGEASSAGVPKAFTECTLVLPLDDEAALESLFAEHGSEIAVVIIEPIPANNGLLLQRPAFLKRLRELTLENGTLLIFDEVISGFRVGQGGAWELYGIEPDLVTYGKIVGGGLPVGAFGGKREYMDHLAPLGPVYQAGTLSGNPLAMAAGLATLNTLQKEKGWEKLESLGQYLEERLTPILESHDAKLVRQGSLFWMSLQSGDAPRSAEGIEASAADRYRHIFHSLLEQGIALAPSAYEVGFLSIAHGEADVDRLAEGLQKALRGASAH